MPKADPEPDHCPVSLRGVHLRAACLACQGHPSNGQRQLARGDVLFMQGDPAERVYAVSSGWLREYVLTPDGRHGGARIVRAGQIVGLEALSTGVKATYGVTVDALRPAAVCALSAASVRSWLRVRPDDALALATATAEDLADVRRQMLTNATLPAEDRVLALVRELIGPEPGEGWARLPATREQLGEVLGLTLETVSRMMQRLAHKGVLEVRGSHVRLLPAPEDLGLAD